jgi:hypothetical protein
MVDRQSVHTMRVGGPRGDDGGKQVKGRQRQLCGETQGFVLPAGVHSAGLRDREGMQRILAPVLGRFPRLPQLWLDAADNGQGHGQDWVDTTRGGDRRDRVSSAQAPPRPCLGAC